MNFSINILAVLVAAIAGVVVNALWYSLILKRQVATLRTADATIAGRDPAPPMYAVAIIGQLLMAFVLAEMLNLTNLSGLGGGVLLGALLWLGFTLPGMAQGHTFGYRARGFILVDAANWLIAAVVMGAILGVWR
jgi:hypothetical protein